MRDSESERLKRLRQKQLSDRDPLVKQRQFQRESVVKEKRMQKSFSLKKAWSDIPHIIRSPFIGLILGTLVTVILPNIWNSPYALLTGAGVTLLFILFGLVLGRTLDMRDDIKDNLK